MFDPYTFDPIPARGKVDKVLAMGDCYFEVKLDGSRQILAKINGVVTLTGRRNSVKTGKKLNKILWVPHIKAWAESIPYDFVLDGELICSLATSSNEVTKVMGSKLDRALALQEWPYEPLEYHVFDTIHLCNEDLQYEPLEIRRSEYIRILYQYPNKYVKGVKQYHLPTPQEAFEQARKEGYEGIIVKWKDSFYHHLSWAKMKDVKTFDFVIMGIEYSDSDTLKDTGCAAIKLGLYDDKGELTEVGRCSGMDLAWRQTFYLDFEEYGGEAYYGAVVEVEGQEMFKTGGVRHPRFKGIRRDLNARDQTFSKYGVSLQTK